MAQRVFVHIGLPKTGTTYLQTIMWSHRPQLRKAGLLLPGSERRDHLWSSCVVRDDPHTAKRNPKAPSSWERLREEIAGWDRDAVISHEFFCSASAEQAKRMVAELAPAEVHVVVTAREPLGLFTASWQESIKNHGTTRIGDYGRSVSEDPLEIWDWRALDLGLVLERWGTAVPADRVHVIPMPPPGSPRELLWQRFAGVLGVDPDVADTSGNFPNESMGVAEAETLRRINGSLTGFSKPVDRGVWIRSYLADERLVPRRGEKYWPADDQVSDCRDRGERAVALVRESGFDVVGDLDDLRVPEHLEERRHPDSVTDAEVLEVATDLIAQMLAETRDLTNEVTALEKKPRRRRRAAAGVAQKAPLVVAAPTALRSFVRRHPRLAALAARVTRFRRDLRRG